MRLLDVLRGAKEVWLNGGDPLEHIDRSGLLITKSHYYDEGDWYSDCIEIFDPETKDTVEIYDDGTVRLNGTKTDIQGLTDFFKHLYEEVFYP